MKKYIILIATAIFGLTSCSLDKLPEDSIVDNNALISASDFKDFGVGLHHLMRTVTSGNYVILSDIQLDDFHAVSGNGNRRMEIYRNEINPVTSGPDGIFQGLYSMIAECNFLLDYAEPIINGGNNNVDPEIIRAAAYAYFCRAYCYNSLADKFCASYKNTANRAESGTGLPLQLTYNPTSDNSKYPGRSSLVETYQQICSDLDKADKYLTQTGDVGKANSIYVTSDACKALLARVYLNMGDDAMAYKYATTVIDSDPNRYPLTKTSLELENIWLNDMGSEIILAIDADNIYKPAATGSAFCNIDDKRPDYIPTQELIDLYSFFDIRYFAWIESDNPSNSAAKQRTVKDDSDNEVNFVQMAKYPGNPSLRPSTAATDFTNKGKPLHISEMYLIAAEAAYNMKDEDMSNKYLVTLQRARQARMGGYPSLSGNDLRDEIRAERRRELVCEGFRLPDVKRWNIDIKRGEAQIGAESLIIQESKDLMIPANDYQLVWPIPQHEMDTNPQLAGQQNPGY